MFHVLREDKGHRSPTQILAINLQPQYSQHYRELSKSRTPSRRSKLAFLHVLVRSA